MSEKEIPDPSSGKAHVLTSAQVTHGPSIPKLDRLQMMDADSWEDMTLELASYWKSIYSHVVRCGGGGDMGRDVIAYCSDSPEDWENFQCKRYSKKLSLADALLEIGKLIYYVSIGEFSYPRKYYFVAPLGVSTDLLNHLMNPNKLKAELLNRWDKICRTKITTTAEIKLTPELRELVESRDFSIFDHIPPIKIIELHALTPYHAMRFGDASPQRPKPDLPPETPDESELTYLGALLGAFGDAEGKDYDLESVKEEKKYSEELDSARVNFYSAENLQRFSRDWLPDQEFEGLLEECHESISPVVNGDHDNGYIRYLKSSKHAVLVQYTSHPLFEYIRQRDKRGFCHQLANDGRIKWVHDESS